MTKDELVKIAKKLGATENKMSVGGEWNICMTEKSFFAFANACEKAGMEKAAKIGERAVICENCGALYWEEVSQCDCQVGIDTTWEVVKVIRTHKE